jgi:hypothetical protein
MGAPTPSRAACSRRRCARLSCSAWSTTISAGLPSVVGDTSAGCRKRQYAGSASAAIAASSAGPGGRAVDPAPLTRPVRGGATGRAGRSRASSVSGSIGGTTHSVGPMSKPATNPVVVAPQPGANRAVASLPA